MKELIIDYFALRFWRAQKWYLTRQSGRRIRGRMKNRNSI
nr:MAG TPA: hypothetical protein [Caudoviricetes sp.]